MEDRPMSLAWELGLIYLVSEILLTLTRRSRSKTGTKQDRSTLGIIWLVIALSIDGGCFRRENFRAAALPHGRVLASASVVLVCRGIDLRSVGHHHAPGRFFTVDVAIEKDHELVERGPFRIVRASFLHRRVAGIRGSRSVAAQLGRPACYPSPDWRGFHSPDECGGGCAFARAAGPRYPNT